MYVTEPRNRFIYGRTTTCNHTPTVLRMHTYTRSYPKPSLNIKGPLLPQSLLLLVSLLRRGVAGKQGSAPRGVL